MTNASDTPVLDTLAAINLESIERCDLDANTLMLVRLAALAAVDARPASYLANLGAAIDSGVDIEQVQDVLVAVAPIIGTPRVLSASLSIAEALGVAIAAIEDEDDDDE